MEICSYKLCCGCGQCAYICPRSAVEMKKDEEGFLRPVIDSEKCVSCGLCERKCPVNNKSPLEPLEVVAAQSKDDKIRSLSSSGGIFATAAKCFIEDGGLVCGAAFDEDMRLCHTTAETVDELWPLMGSKYIQSDTVDIFKKIDEALKAGRKVMFCGTPCQGAAVRNSFGDHENLTVVDFICHGVPTPKLFERFMEDKFSGPKFVTFRDKKRGWEEFSMRVDHEKGTYNVSRYKDPYIRIFLENVSLRPSCYNCSWKAENFSSDITIGDFWGVSKVLPSMNDDKGTSLVIIRSRKGKELFERIEKGLIYKKTDIESSVKSNGMYNESTVMPQRREEFFDLIKANASFEEINSKFGHPISNGKVFVIRCKRFVKTVLFKLMK